MKKWLKKLEGIDNQEYPVETTTSSGQKTEITVSPTQETEIVFPAQAPRANCISGECEYCCMPVVDNEPFLYCNNIGYGIFDLLQYYGACPLGKWAKSQKHYSNLIAEMEES